MKLYTQLANGLLESHPKDAAGVLDSLPEHDVLAVLAAGPADASAQTVRHMALHRAASVLAKLERSSAGPIIEELGADLATNILRRMDAEVREGLVDSLNGGTARSLRALLRFPEGTAGSLMDPNVLALAGDLSASDAHAHIREFAENVRYNLYVVDRDQVLVGVLNLRELLLAPRKALLKAIARPQVLSIPARADRQAILAHVAWRDARSLPVVDEHGVYLGAVRYRTMRLLEEALRQGEPEHATSTSEALGDLFSAGIAGVFAALATTVEQPFPRSVKRES